MTLPSSPPLTLQEIKARYGGPGNLRSYLYGGSYVTSNSSNGSGHTIPSSGTLNIITFCGAGYYAGATFVAYTSGSGSNTVPLGATTACIEIWGGGGGGSCTSNTNASPPLGSGGGAGYAHINVAVTSGQTFSYVCGAGGAGATTAGGAGANGGITTLTGPGGLSMNALPGGGGTVSGSGASQTTTPGAGGTANGSTGVNTLNGSSGSLGFGPSHGGGTPGYNAFLPAALYIGSSENATGSGGYSGTNNNGNGGGGGGGYNQPSGGYGGNGSAGLVLITYS
jgi:hypothetical protein